MGENEWTLKDVTELLGGLRHNVDTALSFALQMETKCEEKELLPLLFSDIDFKKGTLKISKTLEKKEETDIYEVVPREEVIIIELDEYTLYLLKKSKEKYLRNKRKNPDFVDSQRVIHNKDGSGRTSLTD